MSLTKLRTLGSDGLHVQDVIPEPLNQGSDRVLILAQYLIETQPERVQIAEMTVVILDVLDWPWMIVTEMTWPERHQTVDMATRERHISKELHGLLNFASVVRISHAKA